MKKSVIGFICGAIFFSGVSYAASGKLTATIASYKVYVNGKEQNLKNKPVVIDGITYLPVREVSNALGYNVTLNKGNIMLDNGTATATRSTKTDNVKLIKLDATALELSVNNKDYGLASSTNIYVNDNIIYMIFDASVIDLLVSIASGDYIIHETNNDNPDFVTTEHFAREYKYLDIIEKQKTYKLKSLQNDKTYDVVLDKQSSKGVVYNEDTKKHLVPINDVFKTLGLNMEAKYEPNNEKVTLKFTDHT